jgi:carbon storage regulator
VLVLSRRPHESFRIGHDVVITVLEVNGDKVRIGIDAPSHVQVHRQEVYEEVQRANAAAAATEQGATTDLARAVRGAAGDRGPDRPAGTPGAATPAEPEEPGQPGAAPGA